MYRECFVGFFVKLSEIKTCFDFILWEENIEKSMLIICCFLSKLRLVTYRLFWAKNLKFKSKFFLRSKFSQSFKKKKKGKKIKIKKNVQNQTQQNHITPVSRICRFSVTGNCSFTNKVYLRQRERSPLLRNRANPGNVGSNN